MRPKVLSFLRLLLLLLLLLTFSQSLYHLQKLRTQDIDFLTLGGQLLTLRREFLRLRRILRLQSQEIFAVDAAARRDKFTVASELEGNARIDHARPVSNRPAEGDRRIRIRLEERTDGTGIRIRIMAVADRKAPFVSRRESFRTESRQRSRTGTDAIHLSVETVNPIPNLIDAGIDGLIHISAGHKTGIVLCNLPFRLHGDDFIFNLYRFASAILRSLGARVGTRIGVGTRVSVGTRVGVGTRVSVGTRIGIGTRVRARVGPVFRRQQDGRFFPECVFVRRAERRKVFVRRPCRAGSQHQRRQNRRRKLGEFLLSVHHLGSS